jgi:hypothetical protein
MAQSRQRVEGRYPVFQRLSSNVFFFACKRSQIRPFWNGVVAVFDSACAQWLLRFSMKLRLDKESVLFFEIFLAPLSLPSTSKSWFFP